MLREGETVPCVFHDESLDADKPKTVFFGSKNLLACGCFPLCVVGIHGLVRRDMESDPIGFHPKCAFSSQEVTIERYLPEPPSILKKKSADLEVQPCLRIAKYFRKIPI